MPLVPPAARRSASLGQQVLLAVFPHGGQRTARGNAWAGLNADAAVNQAHREAAEALRRAQDVSRHRSSRRPPSRQLPQGGSVWPQAAGDA